MNRLIRAAVAAVALICLYGCPDSSDTPNKSQCKEGSVQQLENQRFRICRNGKWVTETRNKKPIEAKIQNNRN